LSLAAAGVEALSMAAVVAQVDLRPQLHTILEVHLQSQLAQVVQ
jgi:hypothetical protein